MCMHACRPCLYIISCAGEFEFQCLSREVCEEWVAALQELGVSLLRFTDLYRLVDFIGKIFFFCLLFILLFFIIINFVDL